MTPKDMSPQALEPLRLEYIKYLTVDGHSKCLARRMTGYAIANPVFVFLAKLPGVREAEIYRANFSIYREQTITSAAAKSNFLTKATSELNLLESGNYYNRYRHKRYSSWGVR